MGLGSFWCYVWWLTLGAFLGSLLWWLLDKLFLRDTETPQRLALAEGELEEARAAQALRLAEMEELQATARAAQVRAIEISSLKTQLDERKGLEQAYETEYNKVVEAHDARVREVAIHTSEITKLKSDLAAASTRTQESDAARTELADLRNRFATVQQELGAATERLSSGDSLNSAAANAAREAAEAQRQELERIKAEWAKASAHTANAVRQQSTAIPSCFL